MSKQCVNCPGAVDHTTADCPIRAQQNEMDKALDKMRANGLSIDGDNAYKRDLMDAITGALAFGKQRGTPPPAGHWLERFFEIGKAEADERDAAVSMSATAIAEAKAWCDQNGGTPAEFLSHQLLVKRCEVLGRPLTWREAIELTALTTSMPDDERDKLLALDDEQFPPCDYCGVTPDYHPWHGSGFFNGEENPHIHACNSCRHKLPGAQGVEP